MKNIQEYIQQVAKLKEELVSLKKRLAHKKSITLTKIEEIKIKLVALAQKIESTKKAMLNQRKELVIGSYETTAQRLNHDIVAKQNQYQTDIDRFISNVRRTLRLLGLDSLEGKLLSGCSYNRFIERYFPNIKIPNCPTVKAKTIPDIETSINCDESYINKFFEKIEEFKKQKNWFGYIDFKAQNDNSDTFKSILEDSIDSIVGYCNDLERALSSYEQFDEAFDDTYTAISDYKNQWQIYCDGLTTYYDELQKLDVKNYLKEISNKNQSMHDFLEKIRRLYNFSSQLEMYDEVLSDALPTEIYCLLKGKLSTWSNKYSGLLNKIKKYIEENPDDVTKIYTIFNEDLEPITKEAQILLNDIQKELPDIKVIDYSDMLKLQKYLFNSSSILNGAISNPNSFFVDALPIEQLDYPRRRFFEFFLSELENLNSDILRNIAAISNNIINQQKRGKFNALELKECYNNFVLQRSALLGYIAGFSEHICLAYINRFCQRSSCYNIEKLNTLLETTDDNNVNSRERKYIRDLILFIDENIGLMTNAEFFGEDIGLEAYMKLIEIFRKMYLIQYNLGWISYSDNRYISEKEVTLAELRKQKSVSPIINKKDESDDYKNEVDKAFDSKYMRPNIGSRIRCYPVEDIDQAFADLAQHNSKLNGTSCKMWELKDIYELILYDYFYYGKYSKSTRQDHEYLGMLASGKWWECYKNNNVPLNVNYEKLNNLLEQIVDNLYKAQTVCHSFIASHPEISTNNDARLNILLSDSKRRRHL